MQGKPSPIHFPRGSWAGSTRQEESGRLINCHSEPLAPGGPHEEAWHRDPGLSSFAGTSHSGYRGGLTVNNLGYETWSGQFSTVDASGNVTDIGAMPGTKHISIARNQNGAGPDVVAVDIDNGAFVLATAGVAQVPAALNVAASGFAQPISVAFQDGYFHFLSASNQLYATDINATTFNALTYVFLQAKADVVGMRAVAFAGLLFAFTSGSCEVWQDTAQPYPNYPYSRLQVLPYGLLQTTAIDGWETGFDTLLWVSQDYGVWMLPFGALSPTKVSPPDLDRDIEAQANAGAAFECWGYVFAGKRFWELSCPGFTWQFNLNTQQWNEKTSLNLNTGTQSRWRGVGAGHPFAGKWICGDLYSGQLAFVDDTVITELSAPQLRRIEGVVGTFPHRNRIARADFFFSTGAGINTDPLPQHVNPVVAISWSDDNGVTFGYPIVRQLGRQNAGKNVRVSVLNTGTASYQARQWRLDDTDSKAPFMGGTQSDTLKQY
jgi:hypothetical protein